MGRGRGGGRGRGRGRGRSRGRGRAAITALDKLESMLDNETLLTPAGASPHRQTRSSSSSLSRDRQQQELQLIPSTSTNDAQQSDLPPLTPLPLLLTPIGATPLPPSASTSKSRERRSNGPTPAPTRQSTRIQERAQRKSLLAASTPAPPPSTQKTPRVRRKRTLQAPPPINLELLAIKQEVISDDDEEVASHVPVAGPSGGPSVAVAGPSSGSSGGAPTFDLSIIKQERASPPPGDDDRFRVDDEDEYAGVMEFGQVVPPPPPPSIFTRRRSARTPLVKLNKSVMPGESVCVEMESGGGSRKRAKVVPGRVVGNEIVPVQAQAAESQPESHASTFIQPLDMVLRDNYYLVDPDQDTGIFDKPTGHLVKQCVIGYHKMATSVVPMMREKLEVAHAYANEVAHSHYQAEHKSVMLLQQNEVYRRSDAQNKEQSELEMKRAEEACAEVERSMLYAKTHEEGHVQREFLSKKYSEAMDKQKSEYEKRFKAVEVDRANLAKQNETLDRKVKMLERKAARGKRFRKVACVLNGVVRSLFGEEVLRVAKGMLGDILDKCEWDGLETEVDTIVEAAGGSAEFTRGERVDEDEEGDEEEIEEEEEEEDDGVEVVNVTPTKKKGPTDMLTEDFDGIQFGGEVVVGGELDEEAQDDGVDVVNVTPTKKKGPTDVLTEDVGGIQFGGEVVVGVEEVVNVTPTKKKGPVDMLTVDVGGIQFGGEVVVGVEEVVNATPTKKKGPADMLTEDVHGIQFSGEVEKEVVNVTPTKKKGPTDMLTEDVGGIEYSGEVEKEVVNVTPTKKGPADLLTEDSGEEDEDGFIDVTDDLVEQVGDLGRESGVASLESHSGGDAALAPLSIHAKSAEKEDPVERSEAIPALPPPEIMNTIDVSSEETQRIEIHEEIKETETEPPVPDSTIAVTTAKKTESAPRIESVESLSSVSSEDEEELVAKLPEKDPAIEYVEKWDSDRGERMTPPVILLDGRNRRRKSVRNANKRRRVEKEKERESSVRNRLKKRVEILPVGVGGNACEKKRLEEHIAMKSKERRDERRGKAESSSSSSSSGSSEASSPEDDRGRGQRTRRSASRDRKPPKRYGNWWENKGVQDQRASSGGNRSRRRSEDDRERIPSSVSRGEQRGGGAQQRQYSMRELFGDEEEEQPNVASTQSELTGKREYGNLYDELKEDLDISSDSEEEEERSSGGDDDEIQSADDEQSQESGSAANRCPAAIFNLSADMERFISHEMTLDVNTLYSDRSLVTKIADKLRSLGPNNAKRMLYIVLVHTTKAQLNLGTTTDHRVSRCPLIPRFLSLLACMKLLAVDYPSEFGNLWKEFLEFISNEILPHDERREIEQEWFLEHFGRFVGAVCQEFNGSKFGLEIMYRFCLYRGPFAYSFGYGLMCSDSGVLGWSCSIMGFEDLSITARGIVYCLVKSPRYGDARKCGTVIDFLKKSLLIPVPDITFEQFFWKVVEEVKDGVEGGKMIDMYAGVIAMCAVQMGVGWTSEKFVGHFHRWVAEFGNGKVSHGGMLAIVKGLGLAALSLRRVDLPENLQTVIGMLDVIHRTTNMHDSIRHEARLFVDKINLLALRSPGDPIEEWNYERRGGKRPTGCFGPKKRKRDGKRARRDDRGGSGGGGGIAVVQPVLSPLMPLVVHPPQGSPQLVLPPQRSPLLPTPPVGWGTAPPPAKRGRGSGGGRGGRGNWRAGGGTGGSPGEWRGRGGGRGGGQRGRGRGGGSQRGGRGKGWGGAPGKPSTREY